MADWLDAADKVASIVGAAAGVAALVITMRSSARHEAPTRDAAAPEPSVAHPLPAAEPAPADGLPMAERDPPAKPSPVGEPVVEPRLVFPPDPAAGWGEPGQPSGPLPGWGSSRGPLPPARPPVGGPHRRGYSAGNALGLLASLAGTALLGAWLLSWLLSWLGGGSVGPWWLLAGMAMSYGLGLFFWFTRLHGRGMIRLYVVWVPAAAWLLARTVVYHWFPDLFGHQGAWFLVLFAVVLLIGVVIGLRKGLSPR